MSFLVTLDSTRRSNQSEATDNFVQVFNPGLTLYKKEGYMWTVALITANMWYSFYNISEPLYQNSKLEVSDDGGATFHVIQIPDGIYNIYDLNSRIQSLITSNPSLGAGSNVSLIPNFNQLKIGLFITPASNYQVRFDPVLTNPNGSNFYKLLGFDFAQANATMGSPITDASGVVEGVLVGDITNGLDVLFITNSLVRGSYYAGGLSKVLYTFTPNSPPGSSIRLDITNPIYVPINVDNDTIREIRMAIVDNLGRRVDFNGEDIQYLLHFKLIEM
jgi:hypothetical protein